MKKNNHGFTLIELLAVIIILAIILIISVPVIGSLINSAKIASLESSARIILKEIKNNIVSNTNFSLDSINENTIKNYVNLTSDNFSKLSVKEEAKDIYISIEGKDTYDGYTICGTYDKLYVNQPEMCSVEVGKVCAPLSSTDLHQKILDGFIPIANKEDLAAINHPDNHTFAQGTEFEVETTGGLSNLYIQISNIDMASVNDFIPIGPSGISIEPVKFDKAHNMPKPLLDDKYEIKQMAEDEEGFSGEYNGNCYSVDNLTINYEDLPEMALGFFSAITNKALVSNVTLNSAEITGLTRFGLLAGQVDNGSFIENVRVNGKIIASGSEIGGLIGKLDNAQVAFSSANVQITNSSGSGFVGGLIGYVGDGGEVATSPTTINSSFAVVDIFTEGVNCIGGLIGKNNNGISRINNTYTKGTVNSDTGAGSLIGCFNKGEVRNSYSTVTLVGSDDYYSTNDYGFAMFYDDGESYDSFYTTAVGDDYATQIDENELLDMETFENWDFVNTWHMSSNGPDLKELIYKESGEDCFTFDEVNGAITGYDNYCPKDVVIPETIGGTTVRMIAEDSSVYCTDFNGIETIMNPFYINNGDYISCKTVGLQPPFKNMRIKSLTLPSTIEYISSEAFYGNSIKTLVLPNSITAIGARAFGENYIDNLTLPQNIKTIEDEVFVLNRLSNVSLPETLLHIGTSAFEDNMIQAISFSNNILSLGSSSFNNNQISTLTLPDNINKVGNSAFSGNLITDLTLSTGLTEISNYAFYNNFIDELTIPLSITTIGEMAFTNNRLTALHVPYNVKEIGYSAFSHNFIIQDDLTIDNIQGGLTIRSLAFSSNGPTHADAITPVYVGGYELCFTVDETNGVITNYNSSCSKTVVVPSEIRGVTIKGIASISEMSCEVKSDIYQVVTEPKYYQNDGTYRKCWLKDSTKSPFGNKQITSVTLPNTLEFIGENSFADNSISTLNIPSSLKYLSGFSNNTITNITIPNGVKIINGCAFNENLLTSIVIPDSVEMIGYCAFRSNQINTVSLPTSLRVIGYQAFGFNLLTSLTIPEGVTSIDDNAFELNQIATLSLPNTIENLGGFYNNKLTSLVIPSSVKTIGFRAFGVNLITSITIPSNVISMKSSVFQSNKLTSANIQANLQRLETDSFSNNLLTDITLPNGLVYLSGFQNNKIANLTIPNTVTEVGTNAFNGNLLTSISIPSSVVTIENSAFRSNDIVTLVIPDTVNFIGYAAFNDNLINSLTLPSNITKIEDHAFGVNKLTSFTIPSTVTTIGIAAFGSNLITSLVIPPNVTDLSGFNNNKITSITIPSTVQTINSSAFSDNLLTSVTISNGVKTIGNSAFYRNSITSVLVPNSVTTIGTYAFRYNNITSGNARIDNRSGQVSIGSLVFNNNGASKTTTITPTYLR